MASPLQLRSSRLGRYTVVSVLGDLDVSNVDQARAGLDAAAAEPETAGLLLDLDGLKFCDSSGLSLFIAAYTQARDAGLPLALSGVHGKVAQVLRLTGIDQHIPIYPDLPEARRHLDGDIHP